MCFNKLAKSIHDWTVAFFYVWYQDIASREKEQKKLGRLLCNYIGGYKPSAEPLQATYSHEVMINEEIFRSFQYQLFISCRLLNKSLTR